MTPQKLSQKLESMIRIQQPAFIEGAPGIGKSQIMRQTCDRLQIDMLDVRAVLLDPVDLRGLPHVNGDDRAHWCIPDFLPRAGNGVLFLDELNRAPALVQNACLQLVLDRKVGDYTLPDGWTVMAAGNQSGIGVQKMDAALRSRFVFIDAETDLDEWCKWAIGANIEPMVYAFLRYRPELLHSFDAKERSFPCPRTWEFVSKLASIGEMDLELISGAIGKGAAVEFCAYAQMFASLPNIDAILLDPANADMPANKPATMFAIAAALARRCTDKTIGRVITYLDRMPQDYAAYAIRDAVIRDKSIQSTKDFTKWAVKHAEVIF